MTAEKERRFNLAFNIFLVTGMVTALCITTAFKLRAPGVRTFMLLLAAFGSLMGVINTVMSANGNILTFVFGFLDVLIGTVVYFDNGIMGTFALHAFYFLPMQFVGFVQWRRRGARVGSVREDGAKVHARRLTRKEWAALWGGVLVAATLLYFLLAAVDHAKLGGAIDRPKILLDAVVMTLNIAGQVLLSLAFTEQWYIWILVNITSILLWSVRLAGPDPGEGALVMLIKYIFYLLNSLNGLRIWRGRL